ncbi:MFS transporter, PPP family, 3-phenylpropionic acid transporter [Carnobacterium iners]|uniref:MFS transporter, PPP family, 3-phenylpropionic acid transporter n=1 Tax=Carnobacterium iners TaxID=1073423 RepID=A0A1X7MRR4_9LACT|nr:MFS transporter [Carnobacterium iners]SEL24323.1 MFS transporter, PPP family, 3-phenylpropionic acid transporter [Carnobacterium iners]SMH27018.1 MFS transporter, PPP family, 3-phenylpropionic acid transporter [Carnobacterium iners]
MTKSSSLSLRYSSLQGIYWMCFCAVYGFASVFLLEKNFENQGIGFILAAANILSVILQPTLGSFIDRLDKLTLKFVISSITIATLLLLILLSFLSSFVLLDAFLYTLIVSLTLTLQPLINSLAFEHINAGAALNYGLTRGVGSLSFGITSFFLGQLLSRYDARILPIICLGLFFLLLILILSFPSLTHEHSSSTVPVYPNKKLPVQENTFTFIKKYNRFGILLIGIAFLFLFHTIVNTYLVQIVKSLGGDDSDFGLALTIATVCELPAMLGFGYLQQKFKSGKMLIFAGIFFVIRSFAFLFSTSLWMLVIAQLLQGLAFAVYTPAISYYVNKLMSNYDKIKGQTFVVGAATLGSVFGSIIAGGLLDSAGITVMLSVGSLAAFIGSILIIFSVRTDI